MELFGKARIKFGNTILTKKISRSGRKVHYTNISNVKTIGIVWDATRTQDFSSLSRFHQKMHDRNIDVKIIGYYPEKELPDQYMAIRYLSCIRKKEVNFFFLPVSAESDFFITNRFDVLIDINFDNIFPLRYISSLSSASFKVGLSNGHPEASAFELMIELKNPVKVDTYLDEIIHYLEMINSGTSN
jgi:hypothetical protein